MGLSDWYALLDETPLDFSLFLIIADILEEKGEKEELTAAWRALYAVRAYPFKGWDDDDKFMWPTNDKFPWTWLSFWPKSRDGQRPITIPRAVWRLLPKEEKELVGRFVRRSEAIVLLANILADNPGLLPGEKYACHADSVSR